MYIETFSRFLYYGSWSVYIYIHTHTLGSAPNFNTFNIDTYPDGMAFIHNASPAVILEYCMYRDV